MSHHLIVPLLDDEKNSVLVLEVIQYAWLAGFLWLDETKKAMITITFELLST